MQDMTRTFQLGDLVHHILEVWRYSTISWHWTGTEGWNNFLRPRIYRSCYLHRQVISTLSLVVLTMYKVGVLRLYFYYMYHLTVAEGYKIIVHNYDFPKSLNGLYLPRKDTFVKSSLGHFKCTGTFQANSSWMPGWRRTANLVVPWYQVY